MSDLENLASANESVVHMIDVVCNHVHLLDAAGQKELGDRLMQSVRWWAESWDRYLRGAEQKDVVFDHYKVVMNLMDEAQAYFFRPVDE